MTTPHAPTAIDSGTFTLGGGLNVRRLGFGAMRLTGAGNWGRHAIATKRGRSYAGPSTSASI